MPRYTATVKSKKPVDETFAYVADFANVEAWDPSMREARLVAGKPLTVGAEYHLVMATLGVKNDLEYRVVEVERPRRAVLRAETGTMVSLDTVTVEPGPSGGSEVTYEADITLKGPLKLVDPLFGLVFKRMGDQARDGLVRELNR